jgi:hypothetical protein
MKKLLRILLASAGLACAAQASAQVTFYENEGFQGRTLTASSQVPSLDRFGFSGRASSVVIVGSPWEVCQAPQFGGKCVVLRPGRYASLAAQGLNDRIESARVVSRNTRVDGERYATPAVAQVTLFEREGFDGRSFTTKEPVANFRRSGLEGRAVRADRTLTHPAD